MPERQKARRKRRAAIKGGGEEEFEGKRAGSLLLLRPQGAPRGLLLYYLLHKIAHKPSHGYEISQEIEEKTEGAWRPAAGSIYPMLKKLVNEGLIKEESTTARRESRETSQRVYRITQKGEEALKEAKETFINAGRKWVSMRRLFVELVDAEHVGRYLIEGSRTQFQMAQELLESKISDLPQGDAEYILKEYALSLERQFDWTKRKLEELATGAKRNVPIARAAGTESR